MAKRVSLFKVLRRELAEVLSAEGYAEVAQGPSERNTMLVYFRESSHDRSSGLWFQRNTKAFFVDALGSSFTLELFVSLVDQFDMRQRERAYFLLTPGEREEMRALQNTMIARLPPLETVLTASELKTAGHSLEQERQTLEQPFNPRHDVWMRYRDEQDIVAWTSFLAPLLPSLARRFDAAKSQHR